MTKAPTRRAKKRQRPTAGRRRVAAPKGVTKARPALLPFLDFFAGSGLVTQALKDHFSVAWANDNAKEKAAVYQANHEVDHFQLGDVTKVKGTRLPEAALSWASFPCQDLSLAGNLGGLGAERSGLFWQWLRITEEMKEPPAVLVAENVVGLISAHGGAHYRTLHAALVERGYKAGPMVLDAVRWLPHSRPRVFVVAVRKDLDVSAFSQATPTWMHTRALQYAVEGMPNLVWWKMPEPPKRETTLQDIIDFGAPRHDRKTADRNIKLIPKPHLARLKERMKHGLRVAPGYRRTRPVGQVLELRFDGVAGCLRTPEGGSSRQHLVLPGGDKLDTRLLTVREAARLMGAPEGYKLPGTYNAGYSAMGDAVAVPVAKYLAEHLLAPLAQRAYGKS